MDKVLLLSILAGESKDPVTKDKFVDFCKTQTRDYENVYFYDVLVTYSIQYEKIAERIFQRPITDDKLVHYIGKRKQGEPNGSKQKGFFDTSNNALSNMTTTSHPVSSNGAENETTTQSQVSEDNHGNNQKNVFGTSKVVMLKTSPLPIGSMFHEFLKKDYTGTIKTEQEFQDWNKKIYTHIVQEFIKQESKCELNIDGDIKSVILKNSDAYPGIFKKALNSVIINTYQSSFTEFKRKAILTNIGQTDRNLRLASALFMSIVSIVLVVLFFTLLSDSTSYVRLSALIPIQVAVVSILQYQTKFCVMHGLKGTSNKSNKMSDAMNFAFKQRIHVLE